MSSLTADGWEFAYEEAGAGPAVIMLHGILMDRSMWEHQIEALADSFRVIAIDAPGHGESPPRADFSLEDEAAALIALIAKLDVDSAVFCGHSMGGFKSLRIALAQPELVRAMILVDSSAAAEDQIMASQYFAMLEVARQDGVSQDLAAVIASIMMGSDVAGTEEGMRWTKHFSELDAAAIDGTAHAVFERRELLDEVEAIACPTLFVHGADDVPIPIDVARDTARRIPGSSFVEIPRAGHTSPVEQPAAVTNAIRAFVAGLPV